MPTSNSGQTWQLDPEVAVLSTHDLPNFKLISSAEAARPGGGRTPNGWDNLFRESQAGAVDYRLVEAIVVVYGTASDAVANVDQLRQAEESRGAKASPGLKGTQSTTWVEPLGIHGYALVRVVFRMDNVVAQIGLLGTGSLALTDEVRTLAAAQEMRLLNLLHNRS
jgi:hypothetical protein